MSHTLAPFLSLILFLFLTPTNSHSCSSNSNISTSTNPCPPFPPNLPFPFSSSPGCGHPSFQLKCSTPHSFISINNLSFSVLSFNPNTCSISLSPHHPISQTKKAEITNCPSSPSIPNRSINLTSSPFHVTDASCSRLSFLQPCSPPTLPNCSHCPWECKLIKNPGEILHDCRSTHHSVSDSEPTCQRDVLGFLDGILQSGIEVEWDEIQDPYFASCRDCRAKKGFCGFNSSDPEKKFLCFRSQSTLSPPWIRNVKPNNLLVFTIVIVFTTLLVLIAAFTIVLRTGRFNLNFKHSSAIEEDPTTMFLHNQRSASLLPPVFTFEELDQSTNHFNRKIGDGGFGSVYLGKLKDERIVAVKYLHRHHTTAFSTKSFCNEILILSSINHPNLVKLHGYCSDPRGLLLVYDYVPNGTLAEHLHGAQKGTLTWQIRLEIALQTALAIEYLHFSVVPPIVHRDITSSNIFIERDMRIKVGDFGLSRLLVLQDNNTTSSGGFVWTGPQGTPGYLDPDYHRSFRLTEKSDVYSFGVVLLELISGLRAVDQTRDKREMALADLVVSRIQMGLLHQVLDPDLALHKDSVSAVAELAFRCVAPDKDDRPDSKEVVEELKRVRRRTGEGGLTL